MTGPIDPLLVMLERHEAANLAYDTAAKHGASGEHLFAACSETMHAINARRPPATTAAGAIAALECVLNDPKWHAPGTYPGEDFQRHLIGAARDFISRGVTLD